MKPPEYPEVLRSILALLCAEKGIDNATEQFRAAQIGLGKAFRAAREAKGISLRTVAKKLKVSAPFVSDCELGRRNFSDKHRKAYQEILRPNLKLD